jgi:hypothetical protein
MFSPAHITDLHGSLDWSVPTAERYATAGAAWRRVTCGAVLRWAGPAAAEIIVEAYCARCPGRADGFLVGSGGDPDAAADRLCSSCVLAVAPARVLRWVALGRAGAELGVPVRLAGDELSDRIRYDRQVRAALDEAEATLIGAELPTRIALPRWRDEIAAAASGNPRVVTRIADAVAGLADADVHDLYPALTALGRALPPTTARQLEATTAGCVAAARLGLPAAL